MPRYLKSCHPIWIRDSLLKINLNSNSEFFEEKNIKGNFIRVLDIQKIINNCHGENYVILTVCDGDIIIDCIISKETCSKAFIHFQPVEENSQDLSENYLLKKDVNLHVKNFRILAPHSAKVNDINILQKKFILEVLSVEWYIDEMNEVISCTNAIEVYHHKSLSNFCKSYFHKRRISSKNNSGVSKQEISQLGIIVNEIEKEVDNIEITSVMKKTTHMIEIPYSELSKLSESCSQNTYVENIGNTQSQFDQLITAVNNDNDCTNNNSEIKMLEYIKVKKNYRDFMLSPIDNRRLYNGTISRDNSQSELNNFPITSTQISGHQCINFGSQSKVSPIKQVDSGTVFKISQIELLSDQELEKHKALEEEEEVRLIGLTATLDLETLNNEQEFFNSQSLTKDNFNSLQCEIKSLNKIKGCEDDENEILNVTSNTTETNIQNDDDDDDDDDTNLTTCSHTTSKRSVVTTVSSTHSDNFFPDVKILKNVSHPESLLYETAPNHSNILTDDEEATQFFTCPTSTESGINLQISTGFDVEIEPIDVLQEKQSTRSSLENLKLPHVSVSLTRFDLTNEFHHAEYNATDNNNTIALSNSLENSDNSTKTPLQSLNPYQSPKSYASSFLEHQVKKRKLDTPNSSISMLLHMPNNNSSVLKNFRERTRFCRNGQPFNMKIINKEMAKKYIDNYIF